MGYEFFNFDSLRQHPSMGAFGQRFGGRPSWTWQFAGLAAMLVIVIPIIALLLLAVVTFVVVYTISALIASITDGIKGLFGRGRDSGSGGGGGRRNVRVIRHDS
jgi:uncharacterized membrane protein YdcZ (DUF606 family)